MELLHREPKACETIRYRLRAVESARKEQGKEQQEIHLALRYPKRNPGRLLSRDEQELYERFPQFADFDENPHKDVLTTREKELISKVVALGTVERELERVGTLLGCRLVKRTESDEHLFAHTFENKEYIKSKKYRGDTADPYTKEREGVYSKEYEPIDWERVHSAQEESRERRAREVQHAPARQGIAERDLDLVDTGDISAMIEEYFKNNPPSQ